MYCKIERIINKKTGRNKYRASYTYTVIKDGLKKQIHTRTGWFPTIKEAKEEAELKYKLKNNAVISPIQKKIENSQCTIEKLMNDYLQDLKRTPLSSMSAGSKRTHIGTMNTLLAYTPTKIKRCKINEFTREKMELWLNVLSTKILVKTGKVMDSDYYGRHRTEIKTILAFGKANLYFQNTENLYEELLRVIDVDIQTRKTLKVYRKPKKDFRYLNFTEFKIFILSVNFRIRSDDLAFNRDYMYYVLFNFYFFTGVRTEELRGITWNDIIFNDGNVLDEVDINKAYTNHVHKDDRKEYIEKIHNLKNGDSYRRIPILPQLSNILKEYQNYYCKFFDLEDCNYLFFGKEGANSLIGYSTIQNQIDKRVELSRVHHISMHDFRRSCAMYLITELNCDEEEIYRFFGHKDVSMLEEVYAEKDRLRRAKKLNDTLLAKLQSIEKLSNENANKNTQLIINEHDNIYYDRVTP